MIESPVSVTELCEELAKELTRLARPVASRLAPGLLPADLEGYELKLGLKFQTELRELYGWRNGTNTAGAALKDLYFFPWMYFRDLSGAALLHEADQGVPGLKRSWLPIFETGGAELLAVDCRNGRIIHWSAGAPTVEEYLGIREMLATWLECYRTGCFFVEGGELERRDEQFRQIGTRHNPGVDFWRDLPKHS
jgi:hypothetical protein